MAKEKMKNCSGIAESLIRFERPVGTVQSYIVVCQCGWESQHTQNWRRSLDDHWLKGQREIKDALIKGEK